MGVAWLIRCCLLPAVSMLLLSCCFVALLLLIACIRLSRCSGKVIRARKSTGLSGQGNNILTVSLILELVLGLIRCCSVSSFLRKEVIQPHLPVRLPCYDFTPLTGHTLDGSSLAVRPPASGAPDSGGVTGGVYKARERIHRGLADPRLLAIPAS